MAESITVNRTLAWAVGIIGSIATLSGAAAANALVNQGQAIARMEAKEESRSKQIESLEKSIEAANANRYTASDAASDRLAFFKAIQSNQDAMVLQLDSLRRESHDHERTIADLRVAMAIMEPRGKP